MAPLKVTHIELFHIIGKTQGGGVVEREVSLFGVSFR